MVLKVQVLLPQHWPAESSLSTWPTHLAKPTSRNCPEVCKVWDHPTVLAYNPNINELVCVAQLWYIWASPPGALGVGSSEGDHD